MEESNESIFTTAAVKSENDDEEIRNARISASSSLLFLPTKTRPY
jgi:hypothetical protein